MIGLLVKKVLVKKVLVKMNEYVQKSKLLCDHSDKSTWYIIEEQHSTDYHCEYCHDVVYRQNIPFF